MSTSCVNSADASSAEPEALQFSRVSDKSLSLDLYRPTGGQAAKGLLVWVHGGAWRAGSRDSVQLLGLTKHGWAVASVDYRLSPEAKFPAQIHDIKAAIRFLRSRASQLHFPAAKIVIAGSSAGGHLAALVGVSNGHPALEGSGGTPGVSSNVQGIVDLYGASNLTTILEQSTPHGLSVRKPALELLLGGQPEKMVKLAKLASPVFHVDNQDPPLLLLHGDQDIQMPINQAHELHGAYVAQGRFVQFEVVHGAGHGGAQFSNQLQLSKIVSFLQEHVLDRSH